MTDVLNPGQELHIGDHLDSPYGPVRLILQGDGNLVLYRTIDNQPVWATDTVGSGTARAAMQADGNFVLYNPQNFPQWASNTARNSGALLTLQGDGNLVLSLGGTALWASGTSGTLRPRGPDRLIPPQELDWGASITSPNGGCSLTMLPGTNGDGRLVLERKTGKQATLWSASGTGNYAKMQTDGNFLIYTNDHKPTWASHTHGNQGAYLVIQDDGNLVVYYEDKALWATDTAGKVLQWEPPLVPLPTVSGISSSGFTATTPLNGIVNGNGNPWSLDYAYSGAFGTFGMGAGTSLETGDSTFVASATGLPADTDFLVNLSFYNEGGQAFSGAAASGRTLPKPPPPPPSDQFVFLSLDYSQDRRIRIGQTRTLNGSAKITKVVNKTGYALDLGMTSPGINVVVAEDKTFANNSESTKFKGYPLNADWVGTVLPIGGGPASPIQPIEVHFEG